MGVTVLWEYGDITINPSDGRTQINDQFNKDNK